jgi:hypothetical protein
VPQLPDSHSKRAHNDCTSSASKGKPNINHSSPEDGNRIFLRLTRVYGVISHKTQLPAALVLFTLLGKLAKMHAYHLSEVYTQTLRAMLKKLAKKKTPWPQSAIELYLRSDCRLSVKLAPTFADRGCHVVMLRSPKVMKLIISHH